MTGVDSYVGSKDSFLGIDWLNLASSGLKAAGGMSSGSGSTSDAQKKADAERAALEAQKKAAEASAARWKWGVVLVAVAGVGGYFLLRKR